MTQDQAGYLWLGTQEGLVRFDGIDFKIWNRSRVPQLTSNKINALLTAQDGSLWVGTYGGLNRFDGKSFTSYTEKNGLGVGRVWSIYEDAEGIWVGTDGGGLTLISSSGDIKQFGLRQGLTNLRVSTFSRKT